MSEPGQKIVRRQHYRVLRQLTVERERLRNVVRKAERLSTRPGGEDAQLLCVMVVFNEFLRLPDTLRHYRQLGVDHFAILDNGSTDATRDYLCDQHDVDVFGISDDYRASVGGSGWVSALIHEYYGVNRWVLWTDADEQLVYDDCEHLDLKSLIRLDGVHRLGSFPAVMVDMYPAGPLSEAILSPGQRLVDLCPCFDGRGYRRVERREQTDVPKVVWSGGASERVFGNSPGWMAKVPLIRWRPETWYWNPHVIYPFHLNFGRPYGALLHFKYLADFRSNVDREVERNQHASNAEKYRVFQSRLKTLGDVSLQYPGTERFESSRSLVACGLSTTIETMSPEATVRRSGL